MADTRPARRRILDTAGILFYAEGIRAVGIDRIIAESAVAKATFYHHFPSKDDLVAAYVQERIDQQQVAIAALPEREPLEMLHLIFTKMGEIGASPSFRGCPFINAAAEHPNPAHPVRLVIDRYRSWFHAMMLHYLTEARHPDPERTADLLMILRDGLAVGGQLDNPAALTAVVDVALDRLLVGVR
ncbi:TetR/AcrR family transcriptional regulator [Catelliglobosispora koreensis]|uniref:TetR/AcrR family transcriptional regulator n=1 Tax=Catelliglobosispora koreensis TaxID=129052 RepID=UPI0003695212|nr:TetR/AcrR family transcriptional regulator [Catelliglobosispora koreensis]